MLNLSSLSAFGTAATSLSNLILVSPNSNLGYQPQNAYNNSGNQTQQQPPALLFHYEGEQTLSFESDITDHFIEDNTSIADQIALRPEIITTHGFIGELNNAPPQQLSSLEAAIFQQIPSKLSTLSAYTPALSTSALLAYNQAFQAYQIVQNAANAAISSWGSVFGEGYQNNQQTYFKQFYDYWQKKTLFTVQTPWGIFKDCAIKSVRAIQSEDTKTITDFEVQFKKLRFATAATGYVLQYDGRLNQATALLKSNGTSASTAGPSLPLSTLTANLSISPTPGH